MDWPYCLHRSTVCFSLMRKARWKACGQRSCRAQQDKEIQDAGNLQKPILVRSKVPAEQLPKLCREEFQKIDNGTSTLFTGLSSNTRAPTVLNDHFSTKCTRKSLKITLQWEPLASIFHCLKHHSSARPWEGVCSTGLVFHFHLFRGGNKENKHEEGTNSHPRGTKSHLYPNFYQMDFHIPKSLLTHASAAERWQTST